MTERSDFANKLFKALQDNGHWYTGKIKLTDEEFDSYKNLSPKAMAQKYADEHNLKEKNKILMILKDIYKLNQKHIFKYATKDKLVQLGLEYKTYLFVLRHLNTFLNVDGERINTKYAWTRDSEPMFSDAEEIYNKFNFIKKFKLTDQQKKTIEQNYGNDEQSVFQMLNVSDEERLPVQYQIKEIFTKIKTKENIKNRPKAKETFDVEIGRVKLDEVVKAVENAGIEINLENTEKHLYENIGKILEDDKKQEIQQYDNILFMLNKKVKLLTKLLKNEQKYSKLLEKRLLDK